MDILVTGGAGFIGSHLCEKLISLGHRVICIDDFNDFYDPSIKEANISSIAGHNDFTLFRADILDEKIVRDIFSSHKIDIVIIWLPAPE